MMTMILSPYSWLLLGQSLLLFSFAILLTTFARGHPPQGHDNVSYSDSSKTTTATRALTILTEDDPPQLINWGRLGHPNVSIESCQTEDTSGGIIQCDIGPTNIATNDGQKAQVQVQVLCNLDSQIWFDFRRAAGCSCQARITTTAAANPEQQGLQQQRDVDCPCRVCPEGFGPSPIAIDCSSRNTNLPFVISTCSKLNCSWACNGTLDFPTSGSGEETSGGNDRIPPFGMDMSSVGNRARRTVVRLLFLAQWLAIYKFVVAG